MEFRTTIKTADNKGIMHHSDKLLLLGSCFSDNIGAKLSAAMMNVEINPFGTIYNPMSIASSIDRIISGEPIAGADLFQANGVWNSYAFHSRYSMCDKQAALNRMNTRIAQAHAHLKQCKFIIITLGTAIIYRLRQNAMVVANCHKVPQNNFTRKMATVDEMTAVMTGIVNRLLEFNDQLHVIFTVSPIRHIADGLETNSLSKASLRLAINGVVSAFKGQVEYFPAFEIMIDDLRDYRFYAADMVHPSDTAVEYIWQTFQATYFDDRSSQAIARCERLRKRLSHHPMTDNPETVARFNADTRSVVRNMVKEYPYIAELKEIKNLLT